MSLIFKAKFFVIKVEIGMKEIRASKLSIINEEN